MTGTLVGVAVATTAAWSFASHPAPPAAKAADMEIVVLFGTKDEAPSYPAGYEAVLKQTPWNAYNHYEILSTKTIPLEIKGAATEKLPDGSTIEATLLSLAGPKYSLQLVMNGPTGKQISKGTYDGSKGTRFLPLSTPFKQGAKSGSLAVALKVL